MNENRYNLIKTVRNFDASPAVTTGMPQDPYFGPKRVETGQNGQVAGMDLFGVRCWGNFNFGMIAAKHLESGKGLTKGLKHF